MLKSTMVESDSPRTTANQLRQRYPDSRQVGISGPDDQSQKVVVGYLTQDDSELATKFGYNPAFKRDFGYLVTYLQSASVVYSPPSQLLCPVYSAVEWCWLISGAGCMCIAVRNPDNLTLNKKKKKKKKKKNH
jgi:hypothetical protein